MMNMKKMQQVFQDMEYMSQALVGIQRISDKQTVRLWLKPTAPLKDVLALIVKYAVNDASDRRDAIHMMAYNGNVRCGAAPDGGVFVDMTADTYDNNPVLTTIGKCCSVRNENRKLRQDIARITDAASGADRLADYARPGIGSCCVNALAAKVHEITNAINQR